MCGISAIFSTKPVTSNLEITAFNDKVAHRGPDDADIRYFSLNNQNGQTNPDQSWQLALGHRRLSIIDLSAAGRQPMCYQRKYWIVYNGEIYNYVELKAELQQEGYTFQNQTDTEVILAAYAAWGKAAFERLRGMWAVIIYDATKQELILSRDRLGIKPIYLYRTSEKLAVASEPKQFTTLAAFRPAMNAQVVKEYLFTGFEANQLSFFQDVQPIPPGTYCIFDMKTNELSGFISYWSPSLEQPSISSRAKAGQIFQEVFSESVNIHLRSDVPVGCQLSGGVDSSSILAGMQAHLPQDNQVHTFSVTFPGFAQNEKPFVDQVLNKVSAKSHFITPKGSEFLKDFNQFIYQHDEPVGSFSMYAGYALARLIQDRGIKVVLNGQGGDEVLGGYWQMYFSYLAQATKQRPLVGLSHLLRAAAPKGNEDFIRQIPRIIRRYIYKKNTATKIKFKNPVLEEVSGLDYLPSYFKLNAQQKRVFDIRQLILPRLLKWDDRNLMSFSIEGRYPLLDHVLIETCLNFSPEVLYHGGWTKYPIRLGMKKALPQSILFRKSKWGFETPQQHWLENTFRELLNQWIKEDRPVFNLIDRSSIKDLLSEIRTKSSREKNQLFFRIFILDKWIETFNISLT